ncbi:MAG: VanZ family protein [Candidatus Electrothrix sp. GW3-4]|uniref:VanZ family protein n=1 Tax=Candidatus Electrothrix sp. GW3-4 TaxID=3126740 RepID=UPI0030D2E42F
MRVFLCFVRKNWCFCTTIVCAAITFLSLWPNEYLPSAPGGDKLHHLVAYAALVFPVALRRPRWWLLIVVLFITYSGLVEIVQPFVHRYGEWLDMAANTGGLICGILLAELVRRWEVVKERE